MAQAELEVEPPDVNVSCAYDVTGRKFRFEAISNWRVKLVDTDQGEADTDGLRQVLLRNLAFARVECDPAAPLKELVLEALKRTEFLRQ